MRFDSIIPRIYRRIQRSIIRHVINNCRTNAKSTNFFDILIVRLDAIGDYIIGHEIIAKIKEENLGKKIGILCNSRIGNLATIDFSPNNIISIDLFSFQNNIRYFKRTLGLLSSIKTGILINPCLSRTNVGDKIISFIQAENKIGFKGDTSNISSSQLLQNNDIYTRLITSPEKIKHESEINRYLIEALFNNSHSNSFHRIKLNYRKSIGFDYCVFSLGASDPSRAWSVSNYMELAQEVPADIVIMLLGAGKNEQELAQQFSANGLLKHRIINLIGRTTVSETLTLIGNANFVVGNDSAMIHMAVATDTPSLCIAPGAHLHRFAIYPDRENMTETPHLVAYWESECIDCNYRCKFPVNGKYECIKRITPSEVLPLLHKIIKYNDKI